MPTTRRERRRGPAAPPEPSGARVPLGARLRRGVAPLRLPILIGLIGWFVDEPWGWRWLAPLAPLGVAAVVRQAPTPGNAFRRVWVFGWVYFYGSLFWLNSVRLYNPIAPLGIVLLGAYLALYPAVGAGLVRRWAWSPSPPLQYAALGCAWLLGEWLRTLGRLAMPLSQLGHAWAVWPAAIQIASALGELGVSLEVLWIGALLDAGLRDAIAWRSGRPPSRRGWAALGLALGATALGTWVAQAALARWDRRVEQALGTATHLKLRVALLQPNIDQPTKLWSYASPDPAERAMLQDRIAQVQETMLAREAAPDWQLVVLPETAFTEWDFYTNGPVQERVGTMARRAGADLLLGAARDMSRPGHYEMYNSAYLFRVDGTRDPRIYDKMRLVPFGESLPWFDAIPGFRENIVGMLPFAEGREPTIFETHGLRFGVLICFESTFSAMAAALAARGADFIAVITNDGWYGLTAGAARHHHLSLLRAVETRRFLVRCANTGISSIIDPAGRIQATLSLDRAGFVVGTVAAPLEPSPTLFVRLGNGWLLAPLLGLGWLAWRCRAGRQG